ncbi:glycosyltransferase [Desulfovibrio inopinatus]|uniref:glycosyltransferase n=1 Tax=Desulfovibrio inopinatus TaxID=102109 RepID=UPI000427EFD6|nr:glycosyltransferase [Desulfovibrio inopinatus]
MKIDVHVHSKYSTRPSQWFLQKLGCPESFTETRQLYEIAKKRGMSMVTISDHNTIAGALELAHLDDFFISEEITAYFPEDRCKIHVLALNITEAHHREIQKYRDNIYELVPFLRQQHITHIVAHPLFAVNDKLTIEHFEQLLLLFKNFELNGTRDAYQNDILRSILDNLTSEDIDRLSNRYGFEPEFEEPWVKHLTGGSDDHSSLNIASMYTLVPGATTLTEFLDGIGSGTCRPDGRPANPKTMAHNLYSIAYQYYKNKFRLERYVDKDVFLKFIDRFLSGNSTDKTGVFFKLQAFWGGMRRKKKPDASSLDQLFKYEAEKLIYEDASLFLMAKHGPKNQDNPLENDWFRFVTRASNNVLSVFGNHLLNHISGANVFDIFQCIGSAGALYTVLAPYFVAYTIFTKDRAFSREALAAVSGKSPDSRSNHPKVAHFTDTFSEVNGVAHTMQMFAQLADKHHKDLTLITCGQKSENGHVVKNFEPIGSYKLAEYPSQQFFYPPFLDMLEYVYENGFTLINSATPGPIGLAALAISRILKLPINGFYHTAFPQYAKYLTEDDAMEDVMWKYMIWYYNQMDKVFVSSKNSGEELTAKGIDPKKLVIFPRGVDTLRFHPTKANGFLKKRYNAEKKINMLYVGRVSKEKNLHILAEAFSKLSEQHPDARLVITGDGPYREEMRTKLKNTNCLFTGYLKGEDLATLYASCDFFVFPSTTDTFGNVILEAQASGLPVIVTDVGGPQENMNDGETGIIVRDITAEKLADAMENLLENTAMRTRMSQVARKNMENRSYDNAFNSTWELYKNAS